MATILGSEVGIKVRNGVVRAHSHNQQMGTFHQVLLGARVDTNIVNSQGATPLHYARNPAIINVCNLNALSLVHTFVIQCVVIHEQWNPT